MHRVVFVLSAALLLFAVLLFARHQTSSIPWKPWEEASKPPSTAAASLAALAAERQLTPDTRGAKSRRPSVQSRIARTQRDHWRRQASLFTMNRIDRRAGVVNHPPEALSR